MSVFTYEASLRNLLKSGLLKKSVTSCWHAGEPLVMPYDFYKSCFEVAGSFENENLKIGQNIQTNAILVNDKLCELFKEFKVRIGVSLDGPDFVHDVKRKFRNGKGSHAATMKGVKRLKNHAVETSVICVLSAESLNYPDEIYYHFLDNELFRIGFNIEEEEGTNLKSSIESNHIEKYKRFLCRFLELSAKDNLIEIREFSTIENILRHENENLSNSQVNPFEIVNISTNGDFSTFSPELLSQKNEEYGDFIFGNVHNDLLAKSFNTKKFKEIHTKIKLGVSRCFEECDYFSICGGGAPANKYYENGTFDSTETQYCRFNKKALLDVYLDFMAHRIVERQITPVV